jgi:hypothetical protein
MVNALKDNPTLGMVASKRDLTFPEISKVDLIDTWSTANSILQQQFYNDGQELILTKDLFSRPDFFTPARNKVENLAVCFSENRFLPK